MLRRQGLWDTAQRSSGTWINTAGSFHMWLGPPHGGQSTHDAERAGRSILTDPESRLYRKSHNTAAMLCYSGHLLMENRNALIVDAELTFADGYAERSTALDAATT